jgi:hypothetical protein
VGKEFVDIVYEKAVGEGIAKVRRILSSVDLDILVKLWIPGKSAAALDGGFSQRKNFNHLLITDYNYERLAFHVLFNAYVSLLQITENRPNRRNDFRPLTVKELMRAFNDARDDSSIGVIILTGKVPQPPTLEMIVPKKKKHFRVHGG